MTGLLSPDCARSAAVVRLTDALSKVLAGHPPEQQGAALAACVATWLAGHHVAGDEDATRSMRAELLAIHCESVRQLVPENGKREHIASLDCWCDPVEIDSGVYLHRHVM